MTTVPGHRFTGIMSRPNRFNWRRAVAYGPLLGVTIAVMETSVLPLDAMSAGRWLGFELSLMVIWSVAGVLLTSATMLLESRLRPWMMVPFMITFSLLISAGWSGSFGLGFETVQLESSNWFDRYSRLHIFWSCAFYGGLFVFALRVGMQSERTRRLLGSAELARQQTESVLSEARLLSLQGQVDPEFLLRVMVEVERRYARDPAGMGRLLDRLVSFLRAAMPGVRSGASTLAAEVLLAERYAEVCAELGPDRAIWTIQVEGALPELPFPSLLLLPLLDQLTAASGPTRRVELQVTQRYGHCILMLARGAPEHECRLTPELLYRLQVGLRAVFGDAWTLQTGPASAAVVLTLPLVQTAPAVPRPPSAPFHPPGDESWMRT